MPRKNQSRWDLAQNYEKTWWGNYTGGVDWYKEFAKTVLETTGPYLQINKETAILEIGSGPIGAVAFLESDNKTVTLTTRSHPEGLTYSLTVNGILDRASSPNMIAPNTQIYYSF